MVTDADLEKELQATRDANSGDSHYHYMKEAWLLIALRRQSEGIELAQQAQRVWAVNRAKHPSPYGGSIYWEPWIAEAAIALAEGHWSRAEECARKVLVDFEEEGNADGVALIAEAPDPFRVHRPGAGAAFAADDNPVDVAEVYGAEVFQEGFDGEEPDVAVGGSKGIDAGQAVLLVFDADTPPDVRAESGFGELAAEESAHSVGSFRENLVRMPVGRHHDAADLFDIVIRNVLVEEVAH